MNPLREDSIQTHGRIDDMTQSKRHKKTHHCDRFSRLGRACDSLGREQNPSQNQDQEADAEAIRVQLDAALTRAPNPTATLSILVCSNHSCEASGALDLINFLSGRAQAAHIKINLERSDCLDGCEHGPCMALGDVLYSGAQDAMIAPQGQGPGQPISRQDQD